MDWMQYGTTSHACNHLQKATVQFSPRPRFDVAGRGLIARRFCDPYPQIGTKICQSLIGLFVVDQHDDKLKLVLVLLCLCSEAL